MTVTTKELRIQPGKILNQVSRGEEVTITYRGKPLAKIVPIAKKVSNSSSDDLFGLWKDNEDVVDPDEYVRKKRKGRLF